MQQNATNTNQCNSCDKRNLHNIFSTSSAWRVGCESIAQPLLSTCNIWTLSTDTLERCLKKTFCGRCPTERKTTTGFRKCKIDNRKKVAGSAGGCNFGDLQTLSLFSGLHPNSFCRHTTFLGLIELIRI